MSAINTEDSLENPTHVTKIIGVKNVETIISIILFLERK